MKTALFTFLVFFYAVVFAQESKLGIPPLNWSGDLRYRLAQSQESVDQPRPYQQLRARLGFTTEVSANVMARLRLATASSAISTNQTLGDSKDPGFARRSFGVDLAAMEWQALPELNLQAGRIANPFWSPNKAQIVYDSDLAFEGLALKATKNFEGLRIFSNLGGFIISENYDSSTRSDVVDTGILGLQVGALYKLDDWQLTVHLATQQFINIQDAIITSLDKGASYDLYSSPFDRYRGNRIYSFDPSSKKYYMESKFTLEELGFELKTKWDPLELLLFADYVKNSGSSRENTASEYGASLRWERSTLGYARIRKESDSVVGAFTDSDAGGGGTDNDGDRLSYSYQLSKNSQFALNHFKATRGIDSVPRDYSLTQLDFMLQF